MIHDSLVEVHDFSKIMKRFEHMCCHYVLGSRLLLMESTIFLFCYFFSLFFFIQVQLAGRMLFIPKGTEVSAGQVICFDRFFRFINYSVDIFNLYLMLVTFSMQNLPNNE